MIKILSRADLLKLVQTEPKQHSAIVIYEPGKFAEVEEIINNCKESIVLEMNDTTLLDRAAAPTKKMVEAALNSEFEIVACKLGQSRSSAIAFLIEAKRTSPQEAIKILDETKHFPNELILKYGQEILGDEIKPFIVDFYAKLAKHKGWNIKLVTKFFKED